MRWPPPHVGPTPSAQLPATSPAPPPSPLCRRCRHRFAGPAGGGDGPVAQPGPPRPPAFGGPCRHTFRCAAVPPGAWPPPGPRRPCRRPCRPAGAARTPRAVPLKSRSNRVCGRRRSSSRSSVGPRLSCEMNGNAGDLGGRAERQWMGVCRWLRSHRGHFELRHECLIRYQPVLIRQQRRQVHRGRPIRRRQRGTEHDPS